MEPSDESAHDGRGWTHPSEFGTFDGVRREPPAALGRGLLAASAVVGAVIGLTTVWLVVPTDIESSSSPIRAVAATLPPSSVVAPEPPTDGGGGPGDGDDQQADPGSAALAPAPDTTLAPTADTAVPYATEVVVPSTDPPPQDTAPIAAVDEPTDAGTGGTAGGTGDAPPAGDLDEGLAWVGLSIGMRDGVVEVLTVHEGSPAQRAGFAAGHRIVAVDGRPVATAVSLIGYLMTCRPGDLVAFEVHHHGGGVAVVTVELGATQPSV